MNLLEIRQLSVGFGQDPTSDALHGVELTIPLGGTTGLVGESGSGKTLTAYSILKLLDPAACIRGGRILYHGSGAPKDLLLMPEREMRSIRGQQISIVFQEAMSALNPVLKCGFQVEEVIRAHRRAGTREMEELVLDTLRRVGLEDPRRVYRSYPFELSGGQVQRVLIAQAIILSPKLVIADEPTTALDVRTQQKIMELFQQINQELGCSILFISHDLALVRTLCSEVAVMKNGAIVEKGSTTQVFSHPQHPYTRGLLHCRPPLYQKVSKLQTLGDFGENVDGLIHTVPRLITTEELLERRNLLTNSETLLEVEGLDVYYKKSGQSWFAASPGLHAVKGVSFSIREGEALGLVGESGSGKSSIGRSIVQLIRAQKGSIRFKGEQLNGPRGRMKYFRKEIQMVFQDPFSSLNPRQRIGRAIVEPMEIHRLYGSDAERHEHACELLRIVGLEPDHFNRYPHQFSGGQRQRICIARALAVGPRLLICDEAVSALDISVQAQVLNLLKELQSLYGLSYLFISHDLSVVHFIADQIIVLKDGAIVETGSSEELVQSPQNPYTRALLEAAPK